MGMSSSQARLLNLTGRMHQIEYKAAKLEAQKLQMANESAHVYDDYLRALDSTKIQYKTVNNDGSISYVDATYQNLLNSGYFLEFLETGEMWGKNGRVEEGKITINQSDYDNYVAAEGNRDFFIALQTGRVNAAGYNASEGLYEIYLPSHLNAVSSSNDYRLMSDLNMSSTSLSSSKTLGTGKTFDGNGHSITGLNKALFSSANSNSTIKNLAIQGSVSTKAILVNSINSSGVTISDVAVSGAVTSSSDKSGALVGSISGANNKVQRCVANATVTANGRTNIGGLIGYAGGTNASKLKIEDCYTQGSETGETNVGGLVGIGENVEITNCITNTTTYGTHDNYPNQWGCDVVVGGLAGRCTSSTISYCETRGTAISATSVGGSAFGYIDKSTASYINARANVSFNDNGSMTNPELHGSLMGGFMGGIHESTVENSNFTGTINGNGYTGPIGAFVGGRTGASSISSTFTNCYTSAPGDFAKSNADLVISEAASPVPISVTVQSPNIATTVTVPDTGGYGDMYDKIRLGNYVIGEASDPTSGHENDNEWLTNMVNEGFLFIYRQDENGEYYQTSVPTDTGLSEVQNEKELKKAEAKYEADMRKIDKKDRMYDTELAKLDNERNAIKSEMDTLKTVAKENVERTFKLFG